MNVGPQVHFKEGQAGGGGAGVRVQYTEEQLGFGAGILSFHAGGLVLPFRWFECGSQQSLLSNYLNNDCVQQNPPGSRLSPDWQAGGANFQNTQKEYLTCLKYYQKRISHMFGISSKTSF